MGPTLSSFLIPSNNGLRLILDSTLSLSFFFFFYIFFGCPEIPQAHIFEVFTIWNVADGPTEMASLGSLLEMQHLTSMKSEFAFNMISR